MSNERECQGTCGRHERRVIRVTNRIGTCPTHTAGAHGIVQAIRAVAPPGSPFAPRPGRSGASASYAPEVPIHRLILWNIDLTLVDVGQVTREAYAEAFRQVTGRPLVRLAPMAGKSDSEIFFESLAMNSSDRRDAEEAADLLARFTESLGAAFAARRALLPERGRLLPGAREAVTALASTSNVVQTVVTGAIRPNAIEKLRAFGLDRFIDFEVGGYGSEVYPKGTLLMLARGRAAEKYGAAFVENSAVYIADSPRDVAAAQVGGARMIAVASGRSTTTQLRESGADRVLVDLTNTAAVMRAIDQLTSVPGYPPRLSSRVTGSTWLPVTHVSG
jgi:phosphoglycolate phosphatase